MAPRSRHLATQAALLAVALIPSSCGKTPPASLLSADAPGSLFADDPASSNDGGGRSPDPNGPSGDDAHPRADAGCTLCADFGSTASSPDAKPAGDAHASDDGRAPHDGDVGMPDASPSDAAAPTADAGTSGFECQTDDDCGLLGFFGHCEPSSHTCVECLIDQDCGRSRVCDAQGGFICRNPCFMGECGPFGVCDPSLDVCVECLGDGDCDSDEVCHPATKSCVPCITDADCLVVGNPVCDVVQNECVECRGDTDCAAGDHCIEEDGRTVCTLPTSRGLCEPCDTDQDCGGPNDLCVGYIGPDGLFDRACAIDCAMDPNVCPSGFDCIAVRMMSAMQCRPRYAMQTPTCEATRHLGLACPLGEPDPGCGIPGVQDARCVPVSSGAGTGVCTVWCNSNDDCTIGFTCVGASAGQVGNCR